MHTWKIPRIMLVDVNGFDELDADCFLLNLPAKIELDKFFICRMKPKSWKLNIIFINILMIILSAGVVAVHDFEIFFQL